MNLSYTCSMNNILIQMIGYIGMIFLVSSFQQNNRNRILILILTGQLIFIVHFILLGAWTAVAVNSVGAVRSVVFRFRDEKKWAAFSGWPFLFVAAFIGFGLATWQEWYSILPITAMSIETFGLWARNPKTIRIVNLFPHPAWFVYNYTQNSWPGMTTEVLLIVSIVVGIIRFDLLKKSPEKKDQRA